MKHLLIFLWLISLFEFDISAQSVGIGINTPQSSAMLDITSTNKGLLVPRMTSAQRNAISSPAKGLLVFDTDNNSFWFYNGSIWSNMAGGAGLTLPYTTTVNTVTNGFGVLNAGTGSGLYGAATIGTGVFGRADAAGGSGVGAIGFNGATALKATAATGLALDVNGNINISGGNTNPSDGAVLTSDANGNAVWKNNKVAFSLYDAVSTGVNNYGPDIWFTMQYEVERYDYGNYITVGNGGTNSIFTAPVDGLYHFDAAVAYKETGIIIRLRIIRTLVNNSSETIALVKTAESALDDPNLNSKGQSIQIATDIKLKAGEKIRVQPSWQNGYKSGSSFASLSPSLFNEPRACYFTGHLVFAD